MASAKEPYTYLYTIVTLTCIFQGYKQKGAYIATQGPLKNTIVDLWRMIWEFRCGCIVMLCEVEEEGKVQSPIAYDNDIEL